MRVRLVQKNKNKKVLKFKDLITRLFYPKDMEQFLENFSLIPRDIVAIPLMALVFAVFWRLFGSIVISRYLALYEARERASVGAKSGADDNFETAARLNEEFEKKLAAERVEISQRLESRLQSARLEAARIVESAEAEAATLIESTRNNIVDEQVRLAAVIETDADALANSISERALA